MEIAEVNAALHVVKLFTSISTFPGRLTKSNYYWLTDSALRLPVVAGDY